MDRELDQLKREFLSEAEEKVREMESALDGRTHDSSSLSRLGYLAHQLKGSGGSYGYERISTDAAEIEKTVESIDGGSLDSGAEAKVKRHVERLRSEIDARRKELIPSS